MKPEELKLNKIKVIKKYEAAMEEAFNTYHTRITWLNESHRRKMLDIDNKLKQQ